MIITIALLALSAPAPDAVLPAAKPAPSSYRVRYDEKRGRYCLRDRSAAPITGSRLVPEECKTSSDWAAQGITITDKR